MIGTPTLTRKHRFLAAAALCAAVAAGCGGDDGKDEYRERLTPAKQKFDRALSQSGNAGGSRAQFAKDVERLQAAIAEFKGVLDELEAPSEAENEEKAVTEALDEFGTAVSGTNAAVQRKDKEAAAAAAQRVQTTGVALDQAMETLVDAVK